MIKANARATINTTNAARFGVQAILLLNAEQAARIAELEKQVQTEPIRAFIEMYDVGHSGIDDLRVYSLVQSYLMLWEEHSHEWMRKVDEIWGRWDGVLSENIDYPRNHEFINEIRAVIDPDTEEVEQG
ncbi:hypothetical protein [Tumebacillus flagellatus]|uniref:Uncharacterized protein n=1 Tax=Tumebacillus flagellatus TaxID=1157490 RepID=A0A074LF42_9BACL|nr:hypothetical protein [Tumebacillus flagellatus]KEO80866.1 hypothetical protein EL26_23900 [Tumebacillus flagellatus]